MDTDPLKKILIVDDEVNVLHGLRRSLRSQRVNWELGLATSAEEALEQVEHERYDAVVTDIRMPGMGGDGLLSRISQAYPWMVRIVLSGSTEESVALQVVGSAHQFLSKPCDVTTITQALERAFALRARLDDQRLRTLVAGIQSLPSLPQTYGRLVEMMRSEDFTVRDVGRVFAEDPSMTAKILQVVNSAFFGLSRHISNPEDAATLLGIDTLKTLALTAGAFAQFDNRQMASEGGFLQDLWQHSVAVGGLARRIAESMQVEKTVIEECAVSGILHDIGALLLAMSLPEEWHRIQKLMAEEHLDRLTAEYQVIGTYHSYLGAYLLGLWSLPQTVVEAVAFNHHPRESPHRGFGPLAAAHIADSLVHENGHLDLEFLEETGLDQHLDEWRTLARELGSETRH